MKTRIFSFIWPIYVLFSFLINVSTVWGSNEAEFPFEKWANHGCQRLKVTSLKHPGNFTSSETVELIYLSSQEDRDLIQFAQIKIKYSTRPSLKGLVPLLRAKDRMEKIENRAGLYNLIPFYLKQDFFLCWEGQSFEEPVPKYIKAIDFDCWLTRKEFESAVYGDFPYYDYTDNTKNYYAPDFMFGSDELIIKTKEDGFTILKIIRGPHLFRPYWRKCLPFRRLPRKLTSKKDRDKNRPNHREWKEKQNTDQN